MQPPLPDDRLRQSFELSEDGGGTWRPWFAGYCGTERGIQGRASEERQEAMSEGREPNKLPAGNPLVNALMVIAGALAIGVAIVLGFFTFIVLLGIVVILAAVIAVRIWWFGRKMRKAAGRPEQRGSGSIEGEYRVVSRDADRDERG